MKSKRLTIRVSSQEWARLSAFAAEQRCDLSTALRQLALRGLDAVSDEQQQQEEQPPSIGKLSLMRAERLALFSTVMSDLMLREQTAPQRLADLKARATALLGSRWDYQDE